MRFVIIFFLCFTAVLCNFRDLKVKNLEKIMDVFLGVTNVTEAHKPLMKCLTQNIATTWHTLTKHLIKAAWNDTKKLTKRFGEFMGAPTMTLLAMTNCTKEPQIKSMVDKLNSRLSDKSWMQKHVASNLAKLTADLKAYIAVWGDNNFKAVGNYSGSITSWFFLSELTE